MTKWAGHILVFLASISAYPCWAANCADRDTVIEQLDSTYGESLKVGGLQKMQSNLSVMEIWASTETGTYTVILTNANGISCIVAAGTDFFEVKPVDESTGDPL